MSYHNHTLEERHQILEYIARQLKTDIGERITLNWVNVETICKSYLGGRWGSE